MLNQEKVKEREKGEGSNQEGEPIWLCLFWKWLVRFVEVIRG